MPDRHRLDARAGLRPLRLIAAALAGIVAASALALGAASTATAATIDPDDATESILVWVRQVEDRSGIAGISVEVTGTDFDETFVTDDDGKAEVGLPGAGTYTVTLDTSTIPADQGSLRGEASREVTVAVTNVDVPANFLVSTSATSDSTSTATSSPSTSSSSDDTESSDGTFWARAASKLAIGIIFGLLLALASIGVSLIYGTTGLNNFAHGELVTFGGLMAYVLTGLGLPGWLGVIGALLLGGVFGYLQDLALWRPLRRKGVGLVPLMIVSIGLAIATRYVYVLFFGSERLTLPNDSSSFLIIGPVSMRFTDVAGVVISIVALLLVAFVMLRTRIGKAARAVADNRALAAASGINVDRIIRYVWIGGAALAGLSGVLLAYYQSLRWDTGSQILLLIFAAVTLGGFGSAFGALVGSLVISIFMNLSTLVIPENLKYAAALLVMILILLFRPQGILGRRQRIG
ncbi:MAG: branched-chain amino acid ABC transporter permease [Microbacteriaceae bacterium]